MKIIWTHKADKENRSNINYLIENWEKKVLVKYLERLKYNISLIKDNPLIGKYDELIGYHKILITKQIHLFYRIDSKANTLYIVSLWNNHKKLYWL